MEAATRWALVDDIRGKAEQQGDVQANDNLYSLLIYSSVYFA